MNRHSSLQSTQQTGSQFQEQYWEKINSSINAHLNLKEIVRDNYFIYSEQCNEAILAFALALHNTNEGKQTILG